MSSSRPLGRTQRRNTTPLQTMAESGMRLTRSRARLGSDDDTRLMRPPRPSSRPSYPINAVEEEQQNHLSPLNNSNTPSRRPPVLPPASPFTPRTRPRVRLSLARDKEPTVKRKVQRLAEMSNEALDEIMAAGIGGTDEGDGRQAERTWEALHAAAHASILQEHTGPFTPAHEIIAELNPKIRNDIDVDEITDALDRFTLATFAWVVFRPDQAGKMWKGKDRADAGDSGGDSMRTTVHHRNNVLYLAWKVFWTIMPTDIEGNETALGQWLNLATIIYSTYCCPTVEPYSDPSGKMPLPGDFIDMFQFPSLKGKAKARWTQLLQERKRELDKNKTKELFISYPEFRTKMLKFIEQFIYPGPQEESDGPQPDVSEEGNRSSTPLSALPAPSSELTPEPSSDESRDIPQGQPAADASMAGGISEADVTPRQRQRQDVMLQSPEQHESPDLGDMSMAFDMNIFAEIAAEMEREETGAAATSTTHAVDEDVEDVEGYGADDDDLLGGLPTESQLNPPEASPSGGNSEGHDGEENLLPSESQFNPRDDEDDLQEYDDEEYEGDLLPSESQFNPKDTQSQPLERSAQQQRDLRTNGPVIHEEDEDELEEEFEDNMLPSESQFAPRDEEDEDMAADEPESGLIPSDSQFAPHDGENDRHYSTENRTPRSFRRQEPLFAPGGESDRDEDDGERTPDPGAASQAEDEYDDDYKSDYTEYSYHSDPNVDRTGPEYKGKKLVILVPKSEPPDTSLSSASESESESYTRENDEDEDDALPSASQLAPPLAGTAAHEASASVGVAVQSVAEVQVDDVQAHHDPHVEPTHGTEEGPPDDDLTNSDEVYSTPADGTFGPDAEPETAVANRLEEDATNALLSESQFHPDEGAPETADAPANAPASEPNQETPDVPSESNTKLAHVPPSSSHIPPDGFFDDVPHTPLDKSNGSRSVVETAAGSSKRQAEVPSAAATEAQPPETQASGSNATSTVAQPSQAVMSAPTQPASAPNAAPSSSSKAHDTPVRPGNQMAFFAQSRRRTEEGARFATPTPEPDGDGQQDDENLPLSNKRVTGPRKLPPPSSARRTSQAAARTQREESPNVLLPYETDGQQPAAEDDEEQLQEVNEEGHPDAAEIIMEAEVVELHEVDMEHPEEGNEEEVQGDDSDPIGAPVQIPSSARAARISRDAQQPARLEYDSYMVDANRQPLVEDPEMVIPSGYVKPVSTLFGRFAGSKSTYVRKTGRLTWKPSEALFLYREIQKVPMVERNPCAVVDYMHGEFGVRSRKLQYFTAQHMKDKMRTTVASRLNKGLPVVGRARHFLKPRHPDKIAYLRECAAAQEEAQAERRRLLEIKREEQEEFERRREEEAAEQEMERQMMEEWAAWEEGEGRDEEEEDDYDIEEPSVPATRMNKGKGRAPEHTYVDRARGKQRANGHVNGRKAADSPLDLEDTGLADEDDFPAPFDINHPPSSVYTPHTDRYADGDGDDSEVSEYEFYPHNATVDNVIVEIPSSVRRHRANDNDWNKENRRPTRGKDKNRASESASEFEADDDNDDDETFPAPQAQKPQRARLRASSRLSSARAPSEPAPRRSSRLHIARLSARPDSATPPPSPSPTKRSRISLAPADQPSPRARRATRTTRASSARIGSTVPEPEQEDELGPADQRSTRTTAGPNTTGRPAARTYGRRKRDRYIRELDEDVEEQPAPKRSRAGEKNAARKSAAGMTNRRRAQQDRDENEDADQEVDEKTRASSEEDGEEADEDEDEAAAKAGQGQTDNVTAQPDVAIEEEGENELDGDDEEDELHSSDHDHQDEDNRKGFQDTRAEHVKNKEEPKATTEPNAQPAPGAEAEAEAETETETQVERNAEVVRRDWIRKRVMGE